MKILIVDDKAEERYLLETLLKGSGYEVVSAQNGEEALKKLRAERVDIILSDILMPVMDGFQLCKDVKSDEKLRGIPFIFYTATYTDANDEEFAMSLGAERFIRKPMEPEVFVGMLREVIEQHNSGQLVVKRKAVAEETVYLKLYNQALIRKLEDKVEQLEESNKALGQEITERKREEEELNTARFKLQEFFENLPIIAYNVSLDGKILECNPIAVKTLEYESKGELIGKVLVDTVYAPSSRPKASQLFERWKKEGKLKNEEMQIITRQGKILDVLLNVDTINDLNGNPLYSISTQVDVTEQKQIEEALRQSEERYRKLFENVPVGIYRTTPKGEIIDANPPLIQMLGFPDRESLIIAKLEETYVNKEDRKKWQEMMDREGEVRNHEKQLRCRDETVIWVEEDSRAVRDASGRVIYYEGAMEDITERKRAEEALKQGEERYRILVEESFDGIFIQKGPKIIFANRRLYEMLGYDKNELEGMDHWLVYHPDYQALTRERARARMLGEEVPSQYEVKLQRKDGSAFDGEVLARGIMFGDEPGIQVWIRDITERKRSEEEKVSLHDQLRQSQKIEAIGRLSGGIAHDFNNLLTIISGNAQLSLLDLKQGDPLRGNIEEIRKASERAADLTRQLLAFSRKQVMEMQVLDLNLIVKGLDKMLHRLLGEDIDLVTVLPEGIGKVKADPGQIEQVIVNLAVNARDAMIEGGKLTIETADVELDEEYAHKHIAVEPGRYVMLSVSDTGVGMTPEVKERVFEPFFTTKEQDKGTGLGLSTVYGIVKQSGGNIWVYSEPGQGTTFKVYLPQVDEPLTEQKQEVVKEIPRGNETILVVEDEETVRKLAVRSLKSLGYRVLDAPEGGMALLLCEEFKGRIHLILTDVVMPGMSGRKLAERLKQIHPEMKVLYMSGYTDNAILHHGILEPGINFMQKPFTLENLARKVREVLDKA
ncbi:MAG: PAS domain S-box protein [Thermodesulfobacteriota bacterium]|nr:PAS domain S-box protein [Thermodesulfobacteriota bacterium]